MYHLRDAVRVLLPSFESLLRSQFKERSDVDVKHTSTVGLDV